MVTPFDPEETQRQQSPADPEHPIDPGHARTRDSLRRYGPVIFVFGAVCMLIAFADIACTMSSRHHEPTLFWLFFIGIPLLAVGGATTQAGFAGKIARYFSQEGVPPMVDSFNYAAREGRPGMKDIAGAVGEGLRDVMGTAAARPPGQAIVQIRCHKCSHLNEDQAKYCSQCGVALAKSVACPACNELNDPDSRFCDECGKPLKS